MHSYTIKEAIHDEAVLGFMVENLGARNGNVSNSENVYETEAHMRKVLDVILNQSCEKFGMRNGRSRTYGAILTTSSIARVQKYYDLLKKVKEGDDELKISEEVHKVLSNFPRFAITYSLSENEETFQREHILLKAFFDTRNEFIRGITKYYKVYIKH